MTFPIYVMHALLVLYFTLAVTLAQFVLPSYHQFRPNFQDLSIYSNFNHIVKHLLQIKTHIRTISYTHFTDIFTDSLFSIFFLPKWSFISKGENALIDKRRTNHIYSHRTIESNFFVSLILFQYIILITTSIV